MHDPNQIHSRRPNGSLRVVTHNTEPSLSQQQFKDECDINNIMKKYQSTGQFTHLTSKQGQYADFSEITSYQDMLHTVQYAQDAFASLPADMRLRFRNDPSYLLDFIQDPKNYEEALSLGLVNKRETNDEKAINKNELNDTKNAKSVKKQPDKSVLKAPSKNSDDSVVE